MYISYINIYTYHIVYKKTGALLRPQQQNDLQRPCSALPAATPLVSSVTGAWMLDGKIFEGPPKIPSGYD